VRYGLHTATGYATTQAGTAGQIADYVEEIFDATGSRAGFMLGHSQCGPRDQLQSIVELLVPELQRRGRFRTAYTGHLA
jgi:alkanesulfonate monooxygenase SsuD/methylene tetrahydromethanopterin reductase-like flavin-dependent oxidoreductase (luciferase family)